MNTLEDKILDLLGKGQLLEVVEIWVGIGRESNLHRINEVCLHLMFDGYLEQVEGKFRIASTCRVEARKRITATYPLITPQDVTAMVDAAMQLTEATGKAVSEVTDELCKVARVFNADSIKSATKTLTPDSPGAIPRRPVSLRQRGLKSTAMPSTIFHLSSIKDVRVVVREFEAKELVGVEADNWSNGENESRFTATLEIRHGVTKSRMVRAVMQEIVESLKAKIERVEAQP